MLLSFDRRVCRFNEAKTANRSLAASEQKLQFKFPWLPLNASRISPPVVDCSSVNWAGGLLGQLFRARWQPQPRFKETQDRTYVRRNKSDKGASERAQLSLCNFYAACLQKGRGWKS